MNNASIATRATEAMGLFVEAVKQIPSDAWDQPSNLEGWSVGDLVAHTTGTAAKIVTLVEGGEVWEGPSEPDDWRSEDPAGQLRELGVRLQHALAGADLDATRPSPEGAVPLHQALAFPICGLAIHIWDIHRSQDQPFELPEALLGFCRRVSESVPEHTLRRPGGFGPAQPAPEDATPTAGLMANFGRPV
jgi:uncharacterized protein (TIGR03086 family)